MAVDSVFAIMGGVFHPEYYLQHTPVIIALSLAIFSLFFEDIAILISIGIIQHNPSLMPALLIGLYCGFIVGDLLLYAAGRWLQHLPYIIQCMSKPNMQTHISRMRGQIIPMLFVCRAIPASRLPTFLAAGILKVPVLKYLCISLVSAGGWIFVTVVGGVNIVHYIESFLGFSSAWLLLPLFAIIALIVVWQAKRGIYAS